MKKRIILILFFAGLIFPTYAQVNKDDTDFIFKDSLLGASQSIYFDNNSNSKFYDNIILWEFKQYDDESYNYSLDYLKESNLNLIKITPLIIWDKWITLKQYKGKFYAYYPCDFNSYFKQSINDTTFIDWNGEGPVANKIISQYKIDHRTYEYLLAGIYNKERKLIIHIINPDKGIAVFQEFDQDSGTFYYYLMIASNKIKSVPLIVNNCEIKKQLELQFEEPNYSELLK